MKPEKKVKNVKAKEKIQKKKGMNSTLIIAAVAVILLAGIAYAFLSNSSGSGNSDTKPMTLKEVRAQIDERYGNRPELGTNTPPVSDNYTPINPPRAAGEFPSYVVTNPMTLKAYTYATEHPEVLEQIPCYCGCGGHSGHRFLRDCFIHDDGTYDSHASSCDVCVGEALMAQQYLPSGIPTASAQVQTQAIDLSNLSLPDNFQSLSDGLKLIPPGIRWAYFANLKQGTGMEQKYMPGADFYGIPVIGMLNSEYQDGSWAELHDVGKVSLNVKSNTGDKTDNIVDRRPYIFDTKDKTNSVLALFNSSTANLSAYSSFKSILEKVDDKDAGFAKINTVAPSFANLSYFGVIKSGDDVKGEIAFRIKNNEEVPLTKYNDLKNSSASRGFKYYEVQKDNDTLIIRMTSTLDNVISEATQNYGVEI